MPELPSAPVNREPDLQELTSSFLTTKDAYSRNHSPFPSTLSASTHKIKIDGLVAKPATLSISSLQNDYPQHSITAALQCAGNRRHTMRTQLKEVQGLDWFDGAVMNCSWRGPRLRDVLLRASLQVPESERATAHVAFACHAVPCQDSEWYGASIPLERAMRIDDDVILALEMNGQTLSDAHGYPVRVMTPGLAGARAVKWLDSITVQSEPSMNHYMRFDYKVLPPEAVDSESAEAYWDVTPPVMEMPVNSIVSVPATGSQVQSDGESWTGAVLLPHPDDSKWSWKLWEARIKIERGEGRNIFSRATDAAGNSQPRHSQWNLRGVCYNGYGEASALTVQ